MINSADTQQSQLFEILFEHAPLGLAIVDQHKIVRRCNTAWGRALQQYFPDAGKPPVPGSHLLDLLPNPPRRLLSLFNQALAGDVVEYRALDLKNSAGTSTWDLTLAPFSEHGGSVAVLCILVDVTKRMNVQQNLIIDTDNHAGPQVHQLAAVDERDRLARVLHDRLAQALGAIKIRASLAQQQLEANRPDQAQASIQVLKQITDNTYTDVREAIFNLRTPIFGGENFTPMLQDYLDEYEMQYGIDTRLVVESSRLKHISAEMGRQLIRIIQEALSNVRKHAQARQVIIRFADDAAQLVVEIIDNGAGFKAESTAQNGRRTFGLDIMQERAAIIGSKFTITSPQNGGVTIKLTIPLE